MLYLLSLKRITSSCPRTSILDNSGRTDNSFIRLILDSAASKLHFKEYHNDISAMEMAAEFRKLDAEITIYFGVFPDGRSFVDICHIPTGTVICL